MVFFNSVMVASKFARDFSKSILENLAVVASRLLSVWSIFALFSFKPPVNELTLSSVFANAPVWVLSRDCNDADESANEAVVLFRFSITALILFFVLGSITL